MCLEQELRDGKIDEPSVQAMSQSSPLGNTVLTENEVEAYAHSGTVLPVSSPNLVAMLEALLFASGDPLSLEQLSDLCQLEAEKVLSTLNAMRADYEQESRGLWLREANGAWYLSTKPAFKSVMERLFEPKTSVGLSQAAYETLAAIAYNQPCTRAQVEAVRGVNSDGLIQRLEERGLIQVCGTLEAPGRPDLFETTMTFLQEMNLSSATALPPMEMLMYANLRQLEEAVEAGRGELDEDRH